MSYSNNLPLNEQKKTFNVHGCSLKGLIKNFSKWGKGGGTLGRLAKEKKAGGRHPKFFCLPLGPPPHKGTIHFKGVEQRGI